MVAKGLNYLLLLGAMFSTTIAVAQTSIVNPDYDIPSKIAPAYFGPNAFPVPDMLDGRTSSKLKLEFYGDCFLGTTTGNVADDVTGDVFARLTVPIFTPKVNITVWMPLFELFHTSAEVNALRRLPYTGDLKGADLGDLYVSADVQVLSQERHHLDMAVRAVLKTASANQFAMGRCYDAPGYFFDAAIGRGFDFGGSNHNLRVVVSGGFLCWQTDNGRQNDAVMYGAKVAYRYKNFSIDTAFGGYAGWERDGDHPITLKTNLAYHLGNLSIRLGHQVGFRDWPYHQLRLGVSYLFDILQRKR